MHLWRWVWLPAVGPGEQQAQSAMEGEKLPHLGGKVGFRPLVASVSHMGDCSVSCVPPE